MELNNYNDRPKCEECYYFAQHKATITDVKGPQGGLCLRYPPTPMITGVSPNGSPIMGASCPPVMNTHMCGEFRSVSPTFRIQP